MCICIVLYIIFLFQDMEVWMHTTHTIFAVCSFNTLMWICIVLDMVFLFQTVGLDAYYHANTFLPYVQSYVHMHSLIYFSSRLHDYGMHTSSYFTIFPVCIIVYSMQFYALMQPIRLCILHKNKQYSSMHPKLQTRRGRLHEFGCILLYVLLILFFLQYVQC